MPRGACARILGCHFRSCPWSQTLAAGAVSATDDRVLLLLPITANAHVPPTPRIFACETCANLVLTQGKCGVNLLLLSKVPNTLVLFNAQVFQFVHRKNRAKSRLVDVGADCRLMQSRPMPRGQPCLPTSTRQKPPVGGLAVHYNHGRPRVPISKSQVRKFEFSWRFNFTLCPRRPAARPTTSTWYSRWRRAGTSAPGTFTWGPNRPGT